MFSHRFLKTFLIVLVLTGLLVAACTAAPQASPTAVPTEEMSASEDLGTLTVAFGTTPLDQTAHFFAYALENGFYEEQGLKVEFLPLKGDQNAIRAVVSGEADAAWTGFVATLEANAVGADLHAISNFNPKIDYVLIGKTDIKSPKEIEGKNLGVSGPGAVSHQVPSLMILADGGNPDNANLVAVGGSSARVQALIAGDIDAAVLNYVFSLRTKDYDTLHTVADASGALPNYLYAVEVAMGRTIKERPEALQAFVTGTMMAIDWVNQPENFSAAVDISLSILPDTPREELEAGLQHFLDIGYWNRSGVFSQEAFDFSQQIAIDSGMLSESFAFEDYWQGQQFVDAAAEALK